MSDILLYGANGFTGTLIAEACAQRGIKATLAGRSRDAIEGLAARLQLPSLAFSLDDDGAVNAAVKKHKVVLHCAGPFSRTSTPMVNACLRNKVHYLDITGEIVVFEAVAQRDAEAKAAGVMLLPGSGFDVVPSDCLAAHAKRRLPSATKLKLCIASTGSSSHGTSTTAVEHFAHGGAVRKNGVIVPERAAKRTKTFVVDGKARKCVSMPWGDVSTAYWSTHIPDIEVYFSFPTRVRRVLKIAPLLQPLLHVKRVKTAVQSFIPKGGPDAAARARSKSFFVAEAQDGGGATVTSSLRAPEGYELTRDTALLIAQRVVAGDFKPGYQTPSSAYGPDFILEVPGTERIDA
jgi:short subunit dehydrogenase-like uncharacterized protein